MTEQSIDIRDIDNFDTLTNLQALIIDDLRKLGVKIPHRRNLNSMRAPPTEAQKVQHFKNYLGYVPCYYLEPFGHVPSFLVRAAAIIEQNICVEGIFRKSGSVSRQKKIEEDIENEYDVSSVNVFDITSLIKQFFRELREPLLTNFYHDSFLKCLQLWNNNNNNNNNGEKDECPVVKLCLLLPPEHLSTLRFTMNLFSKIAATSEHNKMNVRNLSLVMAPSVLHGNYKGEKVTGLEEKLLPLQTLLLELLISEEKNLGLVSASLYERAETMTACFGNVMEPDSVKVTSSGQKKKERRSGSLSGFVNTIAQSITRWHRNGNSRSNLSQSSPDLSKVPDTSASSDKPIPLTPVILGKRKAPKENASLGLSASKRKATIIGQQPLLPNTPSKRLTSRMKDVSNQYDIKSNILSHTPNRIKISPTKKTKRKPFFQVLCASKNSKKIEEIKDLDTKSKEPSLQEHGFCRAPVGGGKGSRRRKRSASPFRRFMKRKKSEDLAPSSPFCPGKETVKRYTRRSSTGSCYSPPAAVAVSASLAPVATNFVESWITSNHDHSKSVARNLQEKEDISKLPVKSLAENQAISTDGRMDSLITDHEEEKADSDDGFSTISGGTVIFVPDADKKSSSSHNPFLFSASVKNVTTGLNKYDLKGGNYESTQRLHTRSQSVETRRTSLHRIPHDKSRRTNPSKKRSYSTTDTKIPHRPNAIANLKVTGETKKILQRAQVPDKCLIQPGSLLYCSSPVIVDQRNLHRSSSVKLPLEKNAFKSCNKSSPLVSAKQKSFSPAVSKADVLLRHFNKTENAVQDTRETNGKLSSPQWTRYVDTNGQPGLHTNTSEDDSVFAPTPTKCPRLRRISSPLSIHETEEKMEIPGVVGTPGNRRQTEYKQMIRACLNSPNLYKGGLLMEKNTSEICLRSPVVQKKRHRSLDGMYNSNAAAIRQKIVHKEFEKRGQKCVSGNPSPLKLVKQSTAEPTVSLVEKENSIHLSPAPILRYRKEQLPMVQINVTKYQSPQILQHSKQSSLSNGTIKTPIRDIKNVHIKPALIPTPVGLKHQILDHKMPFPMKAIQK